MDPLTAFSCACGVIQVVNFSLKIVSKVKELSSKGRLEEFDDIEHVSKHLSDLRLKIDSPPIGGNPSEDTALLDLSQKCSMTAQSILTELDSLKLNDRKRKRDVLSKSVASFCKKAKIEELEKSLNKLRNVLETGMLLDLR